MTVLPDKLTPLSHDDLIAALLGAFPKVFGRPPKLSMELAIYYGQCITENGATLSALHCFDLGNVKATAQWSGDTCFYSCDETVDAGLAKHAATLGPCELHPQPSGKVRVVCHPPHPWCLFRAFSTANEGAVAYLRIFGLTRYAQAALRAAAGDAVGFVEAAKQGGYFTAPDVSAYARCVASIAAHANAACVAAMAGQPAGITDSDRERFTGLVALTTVESAEGALDGAEPFPLPPKIA